MSREVWFQLVDGEGNPIGTVGVVRMPLDEADVADVREAVKMYYSDSHLVGIAPTDLVVFANRADHTSGQNLPKLSLPLRDLGIDEDDPIIIQVQVQRRAEMHEEPALKKLKQSTVISYEHMNSIGHNLDIRTWQIGGIDLEICSIEPDFPEWFYVRKETLDIIKVFEDEMERNHSIVFVGSPGVGKSVMVVLFAFYLALIQKKRVFLLRKQKKKGFSMLYVDVANKNCWRLESKCFEDVRLLRQYWKGAILCLDGLLEKDISIHFDILAPFRLLATSAQYRIKNDDVLLSLCLVPFWSLSDLNTFGAYCEWPEQEIKERYFYSGGNLRDFTALRQKLYTHVRTSINKAVRMVDFDVATLFSTQYWSNPTRQIDRLRMTGVNASDQRESNWAGELPVKYLSCNEWICVITSEYALRQLGKIVKTSYYEELYSKGRILGDDGLMGIAFENYVHTMARDGKKIELQVRAYDQEIVKQHTYVALEFEAKLFCNDGNTATECEVAMKRLASATDDYLYSSRRCLETIDCVARLSMAGQFNMVGLIKITIFDKQTIDLNAVDRYAKFFPNGSSYIALVPNKETCDNFRLAPNNPDTKVPLKVAYITNCRI